jgi:spore germination cell wall hydrolase CwlJ-like protein
MVALLAVGGGAYLARWTTPGPTVPPAAMTASRSDQGADRTKAGGDWFADFNSLDARFTAARRAGSFAQPVDPTETGSIARPPAKKGDRLGADAAAPAAAPAATMPKTAVPKAATPKAVPGRQSLSGASARATAFGALAPAPWLKIRAGASATLRQPVKAALETGRPDLAGAQPPTKPADAAGLGYARADAPAEAPFRALFRSGTEEGTVAPPAGLPEKMHTWAYVGLKADVWDKRQQRCLAEAIYFESRGESERGQAAVAQVVLNRVRNPAYPDTICDVVYQNATWRDSCQFSFACDGRREIVTEPDAWARARRIATDVTAGRLYDRDVADATHYHASWVRPAWRDSMKRVATIGVHRFYRTYGGGWI